MIGVAALICCGLVTGVAGAQHRVRGEETWRGRVELTRDVEIEPGATLTVMPGTVVSIAATDASGAGWSDRRIEIHAHGVLNVRGTVERPVTFAVAGALPAMTVRPVGAPLANAERARWHGIVLHDSGRDQVRGAQFAGAFAALQVPAGAPQVADCAFFDCAVGIEVGSAYRDDRDQGVEPGNAQPDILRCRFAGCDTGVFVEGQGSPDVRRSVFYRCRVGLGCRRPGYTRPVGMPGPVLARCAWLENHVGVVAPALVQDSIFAWNHTAVAMSPFHAPFSTSIDPVAMNATLLFENARVVDGDTGLDHDPIRADPKFIGPLQLLGRPGAPLPGCLALAGDSPARGVAGDAGDLGPTGAPGNRINGVTWQPAGTAVERVLALPADRSDARRRFAAASAGTAVGRRWWVVPDVDGTVIDLRRCFGEAREGWLALPVSADRADPQLEVNGDLRAFELFCAGRPVASRDRRRRFGERGAVVPLELRDEATLVVLRVHGWGAQPRLGLALQGCHLVPAPTGDAGALVIESARLRRQRRENVLQVTVDRDLNWSDAERGGLVRVSSAGGHELPGTEHLRPVLVGRNRLRIVVPPDWKRPVSVVLRGLRNPEGLPYAPTAPFAVR